MLISTQGTHTIKSVQYNLSNLESTSLVKPHFNLQQLFRKNIKHVRLYIKEVDSSEVLMKAHSVYKFGDIAKMRKTLKLTINTEPDVIH